MTPFAARVRQMRRARGITQKEMAAALGVSPAYLSALEHGRRSPPNWAMVQKIIGYFNVIWDEADELQRLAALSHPRVVVDTAGLPEKATAIANLLARNIAQLERQDLDELEGALKAILGRKEAKAP
ncbi:helix-turn-helix domain-containing protein [Chelativorans intermedius]|uniref:Helix-turn-helix domain-containing protein n=1 Tax=Chelativorans intermedius TaxID=515947 RepID=A0ABV6D8K6_9HYPH|nr:helix-turn-helix transcriptional regulator [Chelativorans intermedius]MCT8998105.1 helix-turn-helix domain-containing protein [Chelativorans intermedius]